MYVIMSNTIILKIISDINIMAPYKRTSVYCYNSAKRDTPSVNLICLNFLSFSVFHAMFISDKLKPPKNTPGNTQTK